MCFSLSKSWLILYVKFWNLLIFIIYHRLSFNYVFYRYCVEKYSVIRVEVGLDRHLSFKRVLSPHSYEMHVSYCLAHSFHTHEHSHGVDSFKTFFILLCVCVCVCIQMYSWDTCRSQRKAFDSWITS